MKKRLLLGRDLCPKGPFEEETKPRMGEELLVICYWLLGEEEEEAF
jgi:hypothetical protein